MIMEHTSAVAVETKVSSNSFARLEAYCLDQWFPKWGVLSPGLICDSSEGNADQNYNVALSGVEAQSAAPGPSRKCGPVVRAVV